MDIIVKLVAEKTGITEAQAKVAVETVAAFLKDKLPAGVDSQVESLLQDGSMGNGVADGLKDALGGFFK